MVVLPNPSACGSWKPVRLVWLNPADKDYAKSGLFRKMLHKQFLGTTSLKPPVGYWQ
jgi:hypothetical protein